jgi:hypothetical protein
MQKLIITTLFLLLVLSSLADKVHVPNRIIRSNPTELEKFLDHVAERESNNTPTVINRYGMLGKYQFSPLTIKGLGYTITKEEFLQNAELQDSVMVDYMRANNRELEDLIKRYEGRIFKGVKITRSGLLAAAHLAGSGGVRNYFNSDDPHGRKDGNGTSVRDYLSEFNQYTLRSQF